MPSNSAEPAVFAVVGAGWRSEFYLRIAQALPERFKVCGLVSRRAARREEVEARWGIRTFAESSELLAQVEPEFCVVSVAKAAAAGVLQRLIADGVPILAETPPAMDLAGLIQLCKHSAEGAKIQVAEQYHLQPTHAARLKVVQTGRLGTVHQAQISISHSYHAISLMRRALGIRFENATIDARQFSFPLVAGPGRAGPPAYERIVPHAQVFALYDFGDRLGVYDYQADQHRSWIRTQRILVRGERGEIHNSEVRYLKDFRTPIQLSLVRHSAGEHENLEGWHLKGIQLGEEWVYENPFAPARLADDEIAVASCLAKMHDYLRTGTEFYSLAEAAQDQYLAFMLEEALQSRGCVQTQTQPWARGARPGGRASG